MTFVHEKRKPNKIDTYQFRCFSFDFSDEVIEGLLLLWLELIDEYHASLLLLLLACSCDLC